MEETVGVGKETARLGEHLCVGCPAQPLVALRTVGRHREVVGTLAPQSVGDKAIDEVIASREAATLHCFGDGTDGN